MGIINYISLAANIILSPISFLLFVFLTHPFSEYTFRPGRGTNVSELVPWTYALFCAVLFCVSHLLVALYNINAPEKVNLLEILQPKYYWLSIPCWLATASTLSTYVKGMEGNIMGFIFFPLMTTATLALLAVNVVDLVHHFNSGGEALKMNKWIAFSLHGLSPLLVLLFYNNARQSTEVPVQKFGVAQCIMAIYLFYLMIIGAHWLVFTVAGRQFDVAEFVGVGQGLVYFLPFIGGAMLHLYFGFSFVKYRSEAVLKKILSVLLVSVVMLCISLQFINYVQYLARVW